MKMKTISRVNTKHLNVDCQDSLPSKLKLTFDNTTRHKNKFVHSLDNFNCEIVVPSLTCDYQIKWKCDRETCIRFYNLVDGCFQYLVDSNDSYCRYIGNHGSFTCKAKILIVATSDIVKLKLCLKACPFKTIFLDNHLQVVNHKGHQTFIPKPEYELLSAKLKKYSLRHSLHRELVHCTIVPETIEYNKFLVYYLNLASLVTITADVDADCRCTPFSVKLITANNLVALLEYEIELHTCAGEDAEITVTAIETLAADSYTELKDAQGQIVHSNHKGNLVKGSFRLPIGTTDIGLHIYTPYGYGDDTRQDKYKNIALFKSFKVGYIKT